MQQKVGEQQFVWRLWIAEKMVETEGLRGSDTGTRTAVGGGGGGAPKRGGQGGLEWIEEKI